MDGTVIEVTDWDQLRELEGRVVAGRRFPRTFNASHLGKVGSSKCVRLRGVSEDAVKLEIDVAYGYLGDVLRLLNASCILEHAGCELVVSEGGTGIWRVRTDPDGFEHRERIRTVTFKRDDEMALKFQKTQYKARDPFAIVSFALDPLWSHWFSKCFESVGWAA